MAAAVQSVQLEGATPSRISVQLGVPTVPFVPMGPYPNLDRQRMRSNDCQCIHVTACAFFVSFCQFLVKALFARRAPRMAR